MARTLSSKEGRKFVKAARNAGWRIEDARSGIKCFPPDGVSPPLTVHSTPKANGHARMNMVREFERHGLKVR